MQNFFVVVTVSGLCMRRNRVTDPSWKSGPVEQKPTDSEHAIHPEDFGHTDFDFDGFSVSEAEQVDGEPLVVIYESVECHRDGCDAFHRRRLLFTTDTLSEDEKATLNAVSGLDGPGFYVQKNGNRIDAETIKIDRDELTLTITAETILEDEPTGQCFGREEPSPDVDAYRYEEL